MIKGGREKKPPLGRIDYLLCCQPSGCLQPHKGKEMTFSNYPLADKLPRSGLSPESCSDAIEKRGWRARANVRRRALNSQ